MGELRTPSGEVLPGYLAGANGPSGRGSVLLIHEVLGVNAQMKRVADRLAKEGWVAFAADLFGGQVAADVPAGMKIAARLDRAKGVQELVKAVGALIDRDPSSKVAVMGFCMGGSLALAVAAHSAQVSACVPFYGIPGEELADVAKIRCPVLGHYARIDNWCTPERVAALGQKLKAGGAPAELHTYDAQHAFFNEDRPQVYSAPDAKLAWERTLGFLKGTLA